MSLLPVEEARARILKGVRPLPSEAVALEGALGRVTATPTTSARTQPPFDASAMDGYAVRAEDVTAAPSFLKVTGVSAAGHGFKRALNAGQAVRIFTGAPLPKGADAVVIQENAELQGSVVKINILPLRGQHIRKAGLDFAKGQRLIEAAKRLNPRDLGLAAAMNRAKICVRRKPLVAVLATGDELVRPGGKLHADQIVSSNASGLLAMACALGASTIDGGIVRDELKATERAIRKLAGADILVTTGGASVGDHDFVQQALKNTGIRIDFWKIAMRPGKPFVYGRKGRQHALGLPGNPVSAFVCAELFLKPLIRVMLGLPPEDDPLMASLAVDLTANDSRQDFLRARLSRSPDGRTIATPFARQDSSMMRAFRDADCLIVRPPYAKPLAAGDDVPILLLDH
jgi:molybdopterin molybdotransferase